MRCHLISEVSQGKQLCIKSLSTDLYTSWHVKMEWLKKYIYSYRKGPPVAMKTRRLLTSIEGLLPQTATP